MSQGFVGMVGSLLPGINKNKNIVSSDSEDYEHSKNVEHAHIPEVQNNTINQIRPAESSQNTKYGPACYPYRTGLNTHEQSDESKASNSKCQVEYNLSTDPYSNYRATSKGKVHTSDAIREKVVTLR